MKKTPFYYLVGLLFSIGMIACGGGEDPFAEEAPKKYAFSVEEAFEIVAEENDRTRAMYTKKIVGLGKKAGLAFHEDWQKDDVEAGPLPALFLRGTSEIIQKSEVPLGLYLGSDFPVRKSNKFIGVQAEKFAQIREDGKPRFFYDELNKLNTAMFPDHASAGPCVSCHNQHPETTKTDWEMNDIMGATTWTYPNDSLTTEEMVSVIKIYRKGVEETYKSYLEEVKAYKEKEIPEIGAKWSDEGYSIPDVVTFMSEVESINSETMNKIMGKI